MPRTSQKNNPGSLNSLHRHLISKSGSSGSKATKPASSTRGSFSEDCDSPYKNSLSKIKRISLNNDGEDDFKTPIKTVPKIFKRAPPKKVNSKTKKSNRKTNTNLILKRTKDNFKHLDMNPEHLQMALALSKSTFAEEYPEKDRENTEPDLPSFLSSEKIPKTTTFLEKYGFQSTKLHLRRETSIDHLEETKKRKNSKFRFVTPILYTRNNDERESLINSKVALILNQQNNVILQDTTQFLENINSSSLKKYLHEEKCWKINSLNNSDDYFCPSLQISPSKSAVGCLLKNWDNIPGRDNSRNISSENQAIDSPEKTEELNQIETTLKDKNEVNIVICETDLNVNVDVEQICDEDSKAPLVDTSRCHMTIAQERIENCVSPDLFDSDDESNSLQSLPLNDKLHVSSTVCDNELSKKPNSSFETDNNLKSTPFDVKFHKEISQTGSSKVCGTELNTVENVKDNGIEYFESFYDDAETLVKHIESAAFVDLSQSSDEDITATSKEQRSTENIKDIKSNQIDIYCENVEKFELSQRPSFGIKMSSVDSGNASYEYNSTKSLNITDYIMDMLNSQDNAEQDNTSCLKCDQDNSEVSSKSQSTCSQESIVVLSDEELNYSSKFSAHYQNNIYDLTNFDCIGQGIENEEIEDVHLELKNKYSQEKVNTDEIVNGNIKDTIATTIDRHPNVSTPEKSDVTNKHPTCVSTNFNTPKENLIIKTNNVTPMSDYDGMDTPKVRAALDKFGIKPLKRQRGVQLLKYIYDTTHPLVDTEDLRNEHEEEKEERPVKKKKLSNVFENVDKGNIKIVGSALVENENEEDLLLERKKSKKLVSCRIPLQIAWYNFLCCNPSLAENIILYEPIQLEVIHSMLKEQSGCSFHIQDLTTFLDKKCITFRTSQSQGSRVKERS